MMTIEEMKEKKKQLGLSYAALSERSGVPLGTVQKVFSGISRSPRSETLRRLQKALSEADGESKAELSYSYGDEPSLAAESSWHYGRKRLGEFTVKDYEALPGERRAELIDGAFYDMSSPTIVHQLIVREIMAELRAYVRQQNGHCVVLDAPTDVQLDADEYTVVQPDVLVVCDREKITAKRIVGAPDLIVEVLSPSTRRKDAYLKLHKYMRAGVREYWIVDPDRQLIYVYILDHETLVSIYHFADAVPVAIWNDAYEVDFSAIDEQIRFLKG